MKTFITVILILNNDDSVNPSVPTALLSTISDLEPTNEIKLYLSNLLVLGKFVCSNFLLLREFVVPKLLMKKIVALRAVCTKKCALPDEYT